MSSARPPGSYKATTVCQRTAEESSISVVHQGTQERSRRDNLGSHLIRSWLTSLCPLELPACFKTVDLVTRHNHVCSISCVRILQVSDQIQRIASRNNRNTNAVYISSLSLSFNILLFGWIHDFSFPEQLPCRVRFRTWFSRICTQITSELILIISTAILQQIKEGKSFQKTP